MTDKKQYKTKICAIVNVTPDSFSDGNLYYNPEIAIEHGLDLIAQGADILDIGGESTRPGSTLISAQTEIERIDPVIRELKQKSDSPLSVDTWKADVAEHCLDIGADIINDITGLFGDPNMADLIAGSGRHPLFVLMFNPVMARPQHSSSMYFPKFCLEDNYSVFTSAEYADMAEKPILEVMKYFFDKALTIAMQAGIKTEQIYLDPGIGFGLTKKENLQLINNITTIKKLGFPIFLGVSRKRFLINLLQNAHINTNPATEAGFANRDLASAALTAIAASKGVEIVRTHTVKEHLLAARIGEAICQADLAENSDLPQYDR
ncbi:MAG TPA: dihydropteroate synthase [Clostridiaceae bacterium]|nr:dihydropteroate synthase [Clostridiaceae bacterium]